MSETNWVRIRLVNGMETTVSADFAASFGAEVLDVPATNSRGVPLAATRKNGRPPKVKTTVSNEVAKKAAAKVLGIDAKDVTYFRAEPKAPSEDLL